MSAVDFAWLGELQAEIKKEIFISPDIYGTLRGSWKKAAAA